ncbi:MAG: hypothetical protein PHH08_02845 [Candidatus ainarchaeum sp.]|nr:hypothetical protein [Candidatus ainarchaeum sp.]
MDEKRALELEIKKIGILIANLEKRLAQKKKSGMLYPEEEEELLDSIHEKKSEIAKFEADIRKIENEAVRGSNMRDNVELE